MRRVQIGQGAGVGIDQAIKFRPAGDLVFDGVEKLRIVALQDVAINPDSSILRPYIEYAERRLIWEYVEQRGKLPACNSE